MGSFISQSKCLPPRVTDLKGKKVVISGSGNVAQYAAEKVIQLGGTVLTLSDSSGFIYDKDGIDAEKLAHVMEIKNVNRERIHNYTEKYPSAEFHEENALGNAL